MKKLGVCLGSGGARGVAHIGFLQALVENDVPIDAITGCSMGSLVGAMFLSGYSPSKMRDMAVQLRKNDILDISVSMLSNRAILKSQKFDKLLDSYFGDTTIENLSRPYACIATDLISGRVHCFNSGEIKTAVRASCSLPLGFKPVKFQDMLLVDGGISNRIPVAEARDLGAEVVVAVDVLAELPVADKINSIVSLGFRSLDILMQNINMFADDRQRPDLLLAPNLGKVSQFKVENQEFCYQRGYELGIENVGKIKKLIV